jgi:hypothetical protein
VQGADHLVGEHKIERVAYCAPDAGRERRGPIALRACDLPQCFQRSWIDLGHARSLDGVAQPVTRFAVATVACKGDSVVMQLSGEGEIARHEHVDCSVRSMTMEDGQARILLGNPTTLGWW